MDDGLMITRRPREIEVQALTRALLSGVVKVPVTFALNRVDVTQRMTPEDAASVVNASDYTKLDADTLGSFLALMGYTQGAHAPVESYLW